MEKFKCNKGWIFHKVMEIGYPMIPLIAFIGYASIGMKLKFEWWIPLLIIALITWVIYAIIKLRKAIVYSVEITEQSIRVSGNEAEWENITHVGISNKGGDNAAIVLHQIKGKSLYIIGATSGIEYLKGFVKGHARNASFS